MLTAALLSSVLGFPQAAPVGAPRNGFASYMVKPGQQEKEAQLTLPGRLSLVRDPMKPRVLNVAEEAAPPSGQGPAVPALKFHAREARIDQSGALSLNSFVEALVFRANAGDAQAMELDPRLLLVIDEEITDPVTAKASSRRLVDGILDNISLGA